MNTGWFLLFLKNYACDMLWAYSLSIAIIRYEGKIHQEVWKACAISICFSVILELLQLLPFISGTFDIWDICAEIGMIGLAAWISVGFNKYKDKRREK